MSDLDELKNQIKETPISHIIGKYISLNKKGGYHKGLCPFHPDSDPSLTVNDTKEMFMCFSCQTGGDAITFVQKFKHIPFLDAIKEIAGLLNISIDGVFKTYKKDPKKILGQKILARAAKLYRLYAKSNSCKEYAEFINSRGIDAENAKLFSIGYAPPTNILFNYLDSIKDKSERTKAIELAVELGVIGKGNSNYYDTFYNRIIFPIWDGGGTPCGFGGRTVTGHHAKYVNSKDSFLFKKRNILFARHMANPFIREKDQVILAEGYMDVRALFQYGFNNSVAVMGTATSEQAITSLKALTKNFIMALDSDSAGMRAMQQINEMALAEGIIPKILTLGEFKDPDEFLKNRGTIALQEKLDKAKTFIDYKIDQIIPEIIPELSDKKLEILEKIFELLSPLKGDLRATERVISAAKRLKLRSDTTQILETYKSFLVKNRPFQERVTPKSPAPETVPYSQPEESIPVFEEVNEQCEIVAEEISKVEKIFLREIVTYPELLTLSKIDELLDFVVHNDVKRYVLRLKDLIYEIDESDYSSVMNSIVNNGNYLLSLKETVGGALYRYRPISLEEKVLSRLVNDLKIKLELEQLKQKRDDLKLRQKECDTEETLATVMRELLLIQQDIEKLKSPQQSK